MSGWYNPEAINPPEEPVEHKYCPICGKGVYDGEYAYKDKRTGDIIGCENCIEQTWVEDVEGWD